jgi:acetyltransferase-like isoleucine patch superfamily enzyme
MPSVALMILFDLVGWIVMSIEIFVPAWAFVCAAFWIYDAGGTLALAIASPFLLLSTLIFFCMTVWALRLVARVFTARIEDGVYAFPAHPVAKAWAVHLLIARLPQFLGVRPFFMGSNVLRWFYLRALGARADFRIQTSSDLYVYDAPMVEIQEEVMIGGSSGIAAHYIENGKITLARVVIGRGSQLMTGILLGPGSRLGERVKLASFTRLAAHVTVGSRCYVGHSVVIEPNCVIGDRVIIGNRVMIESGAEIGDRAVIESGAVIPKGTRIAPGARVSAVAVSGAAVSEAAPAAAVPTAASPSGAPA